MTLLVLPLGLLAVGVAVVNAKEWPIGMRCLPLIGMLVLALGPVLVAVLPESAEGLVLSVWPVLLAAVWSAHGALLAAAVGRE